MRRFGPLFIGFCALVAVGGEGDAAKKDKEKLQGVWSVVELTEGGKKNSEEKAKSLTLEFKGDTLTVNIADKGSFHGNFTLDPTKSPAAMALRIEKDGMIKLLPMIYELQGADLKICHPQGEGGVRPTALESTAGTVLITLKRKTP